MMQARNKQIIVGVTAVILLLSYLFANSGLLSENRFDKASQLLTKFSDIKDELDYEVLKVRTGVLRHYNTLDQKYSKLLEFYQQLHDELIKINITDAEKTLGLLQRELNTIEDAINHLKSDNGVLRNSLMYFSLASEELLSVGVRNDERDSQVADYVRNDLPVLTGKMIHVVRNPRQEILEKTRKIISGQVEKVAAMQRKDNRESLLLLLRHAEVVVEHTEEVNAAIVNIVESSTAAIIEALKSQIDRVRNQFSTERYYYRVALFIVSIMVTIYVGYMAIKLGVTAQALRRSLLDVRYQKMAADKHAIICTVDGEERIVEINQNYLNTYGYTRKEVLGKFYYDVHALQNIRDEDIISLTSAGQLWKGVVSDKTCQDKVLWFDMTVVPFINDERQIYKKIYVGTDITARIEAEGQIEYHAYHDELTGLPNRRMLVDRLEQAVKQCERNKHYGALFFINIDRFKRVNESLGREAGDYLLKQVADRLSSLSQDATAARLTADEFAVMIPEVADELDYGNFVAQRAASKIQTILNERVAWKNVDLHASPSIGITLFPIEESSTRAILKQADTALQRVRESGKGQFRFYHPRMQESVENRLQLESDLRNSFEKNQLYLCIQPQYRLDGVLVGAETLIRWKHPERGQVSPAEFIPLAEETGLIVPIGRWVIEQACILLSHWEKEFDGNMPFNYISVNVSALQFVQENFVEVVKLILRRTNANAKYLELEITEGMLISDIEATIEKISQLRELGVRFSVDDFGTGYSSLMYLSRLPIEQLKIDQGFVRNISTDKYNAAIVETIISMAGHLEMEVIAEGVETEEELRLLIEMGCKNFQGFYYSKPLSVNVFDDLISGIHKSKISRN